MVSIHVGKPTTFMQLFDIYEFLIVSVCMIVYGKYVRYYVTSVVLQSHNNVNFVWQNQYTDVKEHKIYFLFYPDDFLRTSFANILFRNWVKINILFKICLKTLSFVLYHFGKIVILINNWNKWLLTVNIQVTAIFFE